MEPRMHTDSHRSFKAKEFGFCFSHLCPSVCIGGSTSSLLRASVSPWFILRLLRPVRAESFRAFAVAFVVVCRCRTAQIRFTAALLVALLGGCARTPYRYEVHDEGEGSIRVETVPKTPDAAPEAAPAAAAPVAAAPTDQQRIDELQAKVKALSEENQKLKQGAATVPAKD